jgi:hypothetical protein
MGLSMGLCLSFLVCPCLSLSVLVCPGLSLSVPGCPCLSLSVPFCPGLSLSFIVCPCLSLYVIVCPCLFLSVSVCSCLSLSVLVCPCLFLSVPVCHDFHRVHCQQVLCEASLCQFGIRSQTHGMTCHVIGYYTVVRSGLKSCFGTLGFSWSLVAGRGPSLDPGRVGHVPRDPREDLGGLRCHSCPSGRGKAGFSGYTEE